MDVSVIIVSYNTERLLRDCLLSVREQTSGVEYEVIVVDNASGDGSVEMVRNEFSEVRVLALPENVGFGCANNEGIKVARGRNVFLLNPDTLLVNNAVKILSDFLDTHVEVAICGGNLYGKEMQPIHSYLGHIYSLYTEVDALLGGSLSKWRYGRSVSFNYTGKPLDVGYITGADMMVKRDVLERCGLFDPDFFMYFEETELTYRVRKVGLRVVNVPEARIVHLEGQSFQFKERREEMFLTSRKIYYEKIYRARWKRRLADVVFILTLWEQFIYFRFVKRNKDLLAMCRYRLSFMFSH